MSEPNDEGVEEGDNFFSVYVSPPQLLGSHSWAPLALGLCWALEVKGVSRPRTSGTLIAQAGRNRSTN